VTTPLCELVSRLALLAGQHAYLMTARLVQDKGGIELKATCDQPGQNGEFVRHVTFSALEHLGAAVVAKEFARAARAALASPEASMRR
jgi:hypothetical protein